MENEQEKLYKDCLRQIDDTFNFEYYRTLFDPVRFSLMRYLSAAGRKNVGEIEEHFPQDRSGISRHLNAMYKQGILNKEKESKFIYYEVSCDEILKRFEETTQKLREMLNGCSI